MDNLLGAGLAVATAGGSTVALGLFDLKAEVIRLSQQLTGQLHDRVRGLARHDRSSRLQAAHAVLVVSAFFEALDELASAKLKVKRDEQLAIMLGESTERNWLVYLLVSDIPTPSPERSYSDLVSDLGEFYAAAEQSLMDYLEVGGLGTPCAAADQERLVGREGALVGRALERYDDAHRRLTVEMPEFAVWVGRFEARAAASALAEVEEILVRTTSGRDPDRHRAAVARSYRAALLRPIIEGGPEEIGIPRLGDAFVDPRFRIKAIAPGVRVADEGWWEVPSRPNLTAFLTGYLTTPEATDAPMLILGHPGAGKSTLTRMLAAHLPPADFLAVRVPLREVPAEAEIQDQIEHALRREIGETVTWADLARSLDGALPVIVLDGFDELLQATGVHQSDYLSRVLAFQQREARQDRPVAVVVTTRVAVADRARIPAKGLAARLEPFDGPQVDQWLANWNQVSTARGRPELPSAVVHRFPELTEQPLLLLMLALYDATDGALRRRAADTSFDTTELYERLLGDFARREVRRLHPDQPETRMTMAVEEELTRLSIVAFAMFNRSRQWVTQAELDTDLDALGISPVRSLGTAFRGTLTAGEELVGRFFFIQRTQALQDGKALITYEFLHATFGEYLVARLVVRELADAARDRFWARALRTGRPTDDLLKSLLDSMPMSIRTTVLPFTASLLREVDRSGLRDWLIARMRLLFATFQWNRGRGGDGLPRDLTERGPDYATAIYALNLLLITLCLGPVRASELLPENDDPASTLRHAAHLWRAAVPSEHWFAVTRVLDIRRTWSDGRRDIELESASPTSRIESVEPFWSHSIPPGAEERSWEASSVISNFFELESTQRSVQLSGNLSDDAFRHALQPLIDSIPHTLSAFVIQRTGELESIAHSLIRLWLASELSDGIELEGAYERAAVALSGFGGPDVPESATLAITLFMRMLLREAPRIPGQVILDAIVSLESRNRLRAHHVSMIDELLAGPNQLTNEMIHRLRGVSADYFRKRPRREQE
nr:ATP-binding protein [Actinoplanes rishiriensis]